MVVALTATAGIGLARGLPPTAPPNQTVPTRTPLATLTPSGAAGAATTLPGSTDAVTATAGAGSTAAPPDGSLPLPVPTTDATSDPLGSGTALSLEAPRPGEVILLPARQSSTTWALWLWMAMGAVLLLLGAALLMTLLRR